MQRQWGVIDDFIIYRYSDDDLFIIPNATNADSVEQALTGLLPKNLTIQNQHLDFGIIAIQGPKSPLVLEQLGIPTELAYMSFVNSEFHGVQIMVCRTGYTGEVGFEIVVPSENLVELWRALLDVAQPMGGLPAGLGARDILRTEMGYPLHGQDIAPEITPVEALLSWSIGWAKPEFQGRNSLIAMREKGAPRKRVAIRVIGRGIPRAHMGVFSDQELTIRVGEITSGTYSPTLKGGIALALVDSAALEFNPTDFYVDARGKSLICERTSLPFVPVSPR